ncbi:MAG: DNA polymerase III delta prime subunit [Myxococcota bacterium]|jgi:DNA polymerase III delta prime subunit
MSAPILLPERPESDDTRLWPGLSLFVGRLAGMLPALPRDTPLLIAGSWGAGKTTLLQALQRQLGRDQCVWFEAWRHSSEPSLLSALVWTVWSQSPQTDSAALFEQAWRIANRPVPGDAPGPPLLSALSDALSSLIRQQWPDEPPVIFVDDLDRCSPTATLALLDQLRTLLTWGLPCRFVVAMDRDVLTGLLSTRFQGMGSYDGNRYLEKLFPLSFNVPLPQRREAAELVAGLLRELDGSDAPTPAELEHRDALTMALSEPTFANPRLMKRCINRFRLVIHFEATGGPPPSIAPELDEDSDRVLARWIAASERWPRMRRMLQEHTDTYWRQLSEAVLSDCATPGPEADLVLSERGARAWLRREIFSAPPSSLADYRAADLRLRRWGL